MKKAIIKTLSVLLVVLLTITSSPLSGFIGIQLPEWLEVSTKAKALDGVAVEDGWDSGLDGEDLTWSFDGFTLYISGFGDMYDYLDEAPPWYDYIYDICSVVISGGVSSIGSGAFANCYNLTSVTIPYSVYSIGSGAFSGSMLSTVYYEGTMDDWYSYVNIGSENYELELATIIFSSSGDSSSEPTSGTCGYDVRWSYDSGYLYIEGTGDMYDFDDMYDVPWYAYSQDITYISIDDTITSIGDYAFAGCINISYISINYNIYKIGNYAFYDCDNLTDVYYLGAEVQWDNILIGSYNEPLLNSTLDYAYSSDNSGLCGEDLIWLYSENINQLTITGNGDMYDYSYDNRPWENYEETITKVVIDAGVTSISDYAFYSFSNLTNISVDSSNQYFTNDENGVLFNKNKTVLIQYPIGNTRTSYTIPNSVTNISLYAFFQGNKLNSISISYGVKEIERGAFCQCTSLSSLSIGENVVAIGDYAFAYCTGLTSVLISDNVVTIGNNAFNDCTSLTNLTIGESVEIIDDYAFDGCTSLTKVVIPDSVVILGGGVFSGCTNLVDVELGSGITRIESGAFNCTNITNITIPDGVTVIERDIFNWCFNLENITIPDSVTSIGDGAFNDCESLTDVYYLGAEVQWNNVNISTIDNDSLASAIKHFSYSDSEIEVGTKDDEVVWTCNKNTGKFILLNSEQFYTESNPLWKECNSTIKNVIISSDILQIGDYAFYDCDTIETVNIGNDVWAIGDYAFSNCDNLVSIRNGEKIGSINDDAFSNCIKLEAIILGDAITWICKNAFYNTAYYNNSENWQDNVLYIGKYLIYANTSISGNYSIKDGTIIIANNAFENCTNLFNIIIPNTVTVIPQNAFWCCTELISVTLPNTIEEIYDYAFYGCAKMTSISIPNSVKMIRESAFERCTGLTNVTIPNSVNTIEESAFFDCLNLSDVYYQSTKEDWNMISFGVNNSNLLSATIHYLCNEKLIVIDESMHIEGLFYESHSLNDIKYRLNFEDSYFKAFNINGEELLDKEFVGTGTKISIYNDTSNELLDTYTVVLYGDVNGDGLINDADQEIITGVATCQSTIDNEWFIMAADTNHDGAVDGFDVIETELQSLDMHNIEQVNNSAYIAKKEEDVES